MTIFFGFYLINSTINSITFFGDPSISGISSIGVIVSMVKVFRALALR